MFMWRSATSKVEEIMVKARPLSQNMCLFAVPGIRLCDIVQTNLYSCHSDSTIRVKSNTHIKNIMTIKTKDAPKQNPTGEVEDINMMFRFVVHR